jgi:hypothetical protein
MHNNEKVLVIYYLTKTIECITILWWLVVLLFVHLISKLVSTFSCTLYCVFTLLTQNKQNNQTTWLLEQTKPSTKTTWLLVQK